MVGGIAEDTMFLRLETEEEGDAETYREVAKPVFGCVLS